MPVTYIAEYSLAGGRAIMLCNVKCSSEPSLLGERYTESRAVHRSIEHIASRLASQEYVPEQSLVVTSGHSSAEVPPQDMQRGASTAPSEDRGPPPWSTSTPGTSPSCTARTEHGDEEMQSYSPSVPPPISQPIGSRETFFILTDADVVRRRAMFLCLQGDDLDERQAFELLQRAMICEPTPSALAALLFEGQVVEGQVLQDSTMLGGNNTPEGKQSPEMVYFPSPEQGDGEGPREFGLILMRQKVQRQEIKKLLIWGGGALVVVITATIFTLLAVCETDFSLCVN